jgi:glycosyltransferase involved in cell wall biosynthesis
MQSDEARTRFRRTLLFVTNSYSYGGSEKHLLELLKRIQDATVQVIILCTDSDPFSERLDSPPYSNVVIRSERSLKSIKDWIRVFKETDPDTVVLVYGTLWLLPWSVALAARLAGVQKLYAIHHLMPQPPADPQVVDIKSTRDLLRRVFGRRVRQLLFARVPPRLCNMTICVSNAVRDALIQQYGFPERKVCTIQNGVSPRHFAPTPGDRLAVRSKLKICPNDFLLICTARLSAEKGIDVLLLAMSKIIQSYPVCKCIVIGEGPLREELMARVKSLGLGRHVFLEGFQTDVRCYLTAADIFVLTSYVEGLPYSVLEAMASGLPCVVTNVGGNGEAVVNKVTGLVVAPGSVDEVVNAIIYLLTDPQQRARMGEASQARVSKEFDIEAKIAEFSQLILN